MNCRQALEKLYDIIDNESGDVDSQDFEKHLKNCRHCMEKYEFERLFKTFVVDKGKDHATSIDLKQNILNKMDDIDAAGEVGSSPSPFRWSKVSLASAASLVICLLGAYFLSGFYQFQTELEPFVEAHLAVQAEGLSYRGDDPLAYLMDKTGIDLQCTDQEVLRSIVAVSIVTIMGVEFGQLEMMYEGNRSMSIFVTASKDYQLPSQPLEMINGREYVVHSCDKCNLVGFTKGIYSLVSISMAEVKPSELVEIAAFF